MNTELNENRSVYCCYLLHSQHPRYKNSTYIGFTNNPPRRIRQHNGEICNGARKTRSRRPWQMILFVYGFPTKHSALQFEWQWQNPKISRIVKSAVEGKTIKRGPKGQIDVLFSMLGVLPWKKYPLRINWTKQQFKDNYYTNTMNENLVNHIKQFMFVRPLSQLKYFQMFDNDNNNNNKKKKNKKNQNCHDDDHSENIANCVKLEEKEKEKEKDNENGDGNEEKKDDLLTTVRQNSYFAIKMYFSCCKKLFTTNEINDAINNNCVSIDILKKYDSKFSQCINNQCNAYLHISCLIQRHIENELNQLSNDNQCISNMEIIPSIISCPRCDRKMEWALIVKRALRIVASKKCNDESNKNELEMLNDSNDINDIINDDDQSSHQSDESVDINIDIGGIEMIDSQNKENMKDDKDAAVGEAEISSPPKKRRKIAIAKVSPNPPSIQFNYCDNNNSNNSSNNSNINNNNSKMNNVNKLDDKSDNESNDDSDQSDIIHMSLADKLRKRGFQLR